MYLSLMGVQHLCLLQQLPKGILDLLNYAIRDDAMTVFPFSVTNLCHKMSVKFFTFMMDLFMILAGSPLALKTITN